jgi:hypothetical protein
MKAEIRPFKISIADQTLSDLSWRLEHTRWTYQSQGTDWDTGTDLNYLKDLVDY